MAGSYFAVMGGYTFLPFGEDPLERPKMPAIRLSPHGLAFLLRAGIIATPKLAALQGEVVDKGKANMFAKFIVCAQALWMVVNCICRKAADLPVTLIELNVVMHVVCAVIVYGFWWKKPLDAGRAIPFSSSFLRPGMCALLAMIYWQICGKGSLRALKEKPETKPPIDDNGAIIPTPSAEPPEFEVLQNKTSLRVSGDFPKPDNWLLRAIKLAKRVDGLVMLFPGQTLVNPITGFEYTCRDRDPQHLTKHDLELFERATNELRSPEFPYLRCSDDKQYTLFPLSFNLFDPPRSHQYFAMAMSWLRPINLTTVKSRLHSSLVLREPESAEIKLVAPVIFTLSIFYDGVHTTTWNSHFPTLTERRIWRAACVITGALGVVVAALAILWVLGSCIYRICSNQINQSVFLYVPLAGQLDRRMGNWINNIDDWIRSNPLWLNMLVLFFPGLLCIAGFIAYICLLIFVGYIYPAARLYIVVESFISVRSLPEGSFETVRWGDFWPHL